MKKEYDIIETAKQNGNFRVFVQALEAVGLSEPLHESGPYTIFAPTDDAFTKLPKGKIETLFKTENKEPLRSLLRKHIVPGKVFSSSELKQLDDVKGADGNVLRIESRAGVWVNEAQVLSPDLVASNGVVHGIDTVLMSENQAATAA